MKQSHCAFLLVVLCAGFTANAEPNRNENPDLFLSENSKLKTQGCYQFNQSLSLCFDIQLNSIRLATKDGRTLVFDQELGKDLSLLEILGARFLSRGSRMILIPDDAPTSPDALLAYLRHHFGPEYQPTAAEVQLLRLNHQKALEDLGKTPEFLLVGFVLASFIEQPPVQDITPFREMCAGLLKIMPVELPAEFQPVDQRQHHGREKRCIDLRTRKHLDPECRGMCGRRCSCWWWVCGDCCHHEGCWQHDMCCAKSWNSNYCQKPWNYGFSCGSYGGYPACLSG